MAKTNSKDSKYSVGSHYHFEMPFNPPGGFDETVSISGKVVYNNGEIAVVRISHRFIEFEGVIHYFEETCERFPDFKPDYVPQWSDEYLWIDLAVEGFGGLIPNHEFDESNIFHEEGPGRAQTNIPSHLTLHPTNHPKIVFVGGDLFGKEGLSRFDGFICFADRHFRAYVQALVEEGYPQCPNRMHFEDDLHPLQVRDMLLEDLDILSGKGCRRIGIHAPGYVPASKAALRATVDWLAGDGRDTVDTLCFVDAHDDYFHCFGLDPLGRGRGLRNPSPTEFERYFKRAFPREMDEAFGPRVDSEGVSAYCISKSELREKGWRPAHPIPFSVGLFYTNLVPQVVAKVTGSMRDTYDFLKVSKMPRIDIPMAGFMDSHTVLSDSGLLPEGKEDVTAWLRLAREESGYFFRVLIHHIIGGIREPRTLPAVRLSHLSEKQIENMGKEMMRYLDCFEASLKGGPVPPGYYLPDEIRCRQ